jgi:hypothetical protein
MNQLVVVSIYDGWYVGFEDDFNESCISVNSKDDGVLLVIHWQDWINGSDV